VKISTNKLNRYLLFAFAIIVAGFEHTFYLINTDSIRIFGITYIDLFIMQILVFCVIVWYVYQKYPNPKFQFKYLMLFVVVLSIISSIQSNKLFDQSISLGLRPQRYWIACAILYFPISKLLYLKKIKIKQLEDMIFVIGTIEIVLYIAQYFLFDHLSFLYVSHNYRYGDVRLYFSNVFLNLLLFLNLDRFFNNYKRIQSITYIFLILYIVMVVGKMRMTSVAVISAIGLGILLWKRGGKSKIVTLMLAVVGSLAFLNLIIVQDIISSILEGDTNLTIRVLGREYLLDKISLHPIFGWGYPHGDWAPSMVNMGGYGLNDNGIYGFLYIYGFFGVVWAVALFIKLLYMGNKIRIKERSYYYLLVPIYWIVAMQSELHWYWETGFIVMTILVSLLEQKYRELFNRNTDMNNINDNHARPLENVKYSK